jgi:hypothetical protein
MKIDRTDRKILVAVLLLLVALTIVAALAPQEEQSGYQPPTTYSASSGGAKAAYLVLQELGYDVQRWEQPPKELPKEASGCTLILMSPEQYADKGEQDALKKFVQSGGRLLVDSRSVYLIRDPEQVPSFLGSGQQLFSPQAPDRLNAGGKQISMVAQYRWSKTDATVLPVYGDATGAVVARYRMGEGEVIWWAGATPLTNAGLREAGNLELLLNSIGDKSKTTVLWDEYFHGSRRGFTGLIANTPVPWGILQLGVLFLAGIFTFSRRSGPVHDYNDPARLSPLEFVYTLGNLYRRAEGNEVAVDVALQRCRLLLSKRLGTPTNSTPEEIYLALTTRTHFRDEDFTSVMRQAHAAAKSPDVNPKDALALVRKLQQYCLDLKLTPKSGEQN